MTLLAATTEVAAGADDSADAPAEAPATSKRAERYLTSITKREPRRTCAEVPDSTTKTYDFQHLLDERPLRKGCFAKVSMSDRFDQRETANRLSALVVHLAD